MYRKYVRKWWPFKRNSIICPEFCCKWQILSGLTDILEYVTKKGHSEIFAWKKSKFFVSLPGKNEILWKFAWKYRNFTWKNRNFSEICLEKSNFFHPNPRPPYFKPVWRRCAAVHLCMRESVFHSLHWFVAAFNRHVWWLILILNKTYYYYGELNILYYCIYYYSDQLYVKGIIISMYSKLIMFSLSLYLMRFMLICNNY